MLEGIPATSLWGLRARAEEHLKPEGLFKDPEALAWYEKLKPFYTPEINRWYHPVLQKAIAIRTDILDEAVRQHIYSQKNAVLVELGCGFSTRYSRLGSPDCHWYELDLPEMIQLRGSLGVRGENYWHLASSAFDPLWMEDIGHEPSEQMLLIAEGLFMYFPKPQVLALLNQMKTALKGAHLAFDVMGDLNLSSAQIPAEDVDAPMYWGVPHLNTFCKELGLEPVKDLSYAAQMKRRPYYKKYISPVARILLRIPQVTRRMGGTLFVKL